MELDFDVEVLEAAQPHGGSYLALVFTFVKSGRKIYRGSIFFLFHGNGGEFEGAGSGACYRGICLAPRTVFFVSGGIWGGDGGLRVLWIQSTCASNTGSWNIRDYLYIHGC